ncbi:MAG: prepilin-type N-terminal cleavage/methylation domain-containing protein [Candidatus Eisenbacteria bacterium]|nr:prepilin-type N-terminal cleavage/methylation domain-containing protein [Candidatus Eisenbacteria bacterium]
MPAPERDSSRTRGFTLIEIMITLVILSVVMGAVMAVVHAAGRSKASTSNHVESVQAARVAVDMMARDLRSAGFGCDLDWAAAPQWPLAYIDSTQVILCANLDPFPENVVHRAPLAYDPNGSPRPRPLDGTGWTPARKYRTGAELVRWTLDVNDDGNVDVADVQDSNGVDARRTPNPDDFDLVRQVYGDSSDGTAGHNGGTTERIALVRRPGGGVPAMFTVYMKGSGTPWNWSNGPVPAAQLQDIERIVVNVVAPSAKPDWRHQYAETQLTAQVNSLRNIPSFGQNEYVVEGYVFDDANQNQALDAGESGLLGVTVLLGATYSAVTDSLGYFRFRAPTGSYSLRHVPPTGYGVLNSPDSFLVTVGPGVMRSFADTARAGGWVAATAFEDLDGDGVQDVGEPVKLGVQFTLTPGPDAKTTNKFGQARLFAPPGAYTVTATVPDSFAASTTNPVTGTMVDGGSASLAFGLQRVALGTVRGTVYRDNNRNGTLDGGESGIQNVWVGVSSNGGLSVAGFAWTDASGNYSVNVPANNPPGTTPYAILCIPPLGYYATSTTAIKNVLLSGGQVLTGKNFGMAAYQVITLNASRVLSLGSTDLIEKDWNGNQTQNARKDVDLVLGADAGGTDNVSVWFNQYSATPLFTAAPASPTGYTRNAPNSVLALALDTLDASAPVARPDLVTGTQNATAGNLFVWLNQNTSNNEGYFPLSYSQAYRTQDAGDVQSVLTMDCAGGAMPDLIVGTRSPLAGTGTIEIWQSNDAAIPAFTRQEVYPPAGGIPGNALGAVAAMALADFDGDGRRDLVVGTRTGTYNGELLFFRNVSKLNGARFVCRSRYTITGAAVTAITTLDVDSDGRQDVVLGAQTGFATGGLQYWHNRGTGNLDFDLLQQVTAPGIVLATASGDFGGLTTRDVAIGWRQSETSYAGGVLVYSTDLGQLATAGSDPSGGAVVNMVPALTVNNFNYGVQPAPPSPPFLQDLAAGVKMSPTTGALVVFIR